MSRVVPMSEYGASTLNELYRRVACERCGARRGEHCRSRNGTPANPHVARIQRADVMYPPTREERSPSFCGIAGWDENRSKVCTLPYRHSGNHSAAVPDATGVGEGEPE